MRERSVELEERIAANKKRFYEERRAARICIRCVAPARAGRTQCAECALKRRERHERKKKSGLCVLCDSPRDSERLHCAECLAWAQSRHASLPAGQAAARSREYRDRMRSDPGAYRAWLDAQKIVRKKRKAAGLCRCGAPSEARRSECAACLLKARERYKARIAASRHE